MHGLMLAAPHSGAGKTLLTLVILRRLQQKGIRIAPFKAGPDYIDPTLHRLACGQSSRNLDPWAMRPEFIQELTTRADKEGHLVIVEAMMGLFDGAVDGTATPADLARSLKLPIVLIVDCCKMSHSIAALVSGFHHFRPDVAVSGLILNKVGSTRHEHMLRQALERLNIPILGAVHRHETLVMPERHLGLTLPKNLSQFEDFIAQATERVESQLDWGELTKLAQQAGRVEFLPVSLSRFPPLGKNIAIARDDAFCFSYPHILESWQQVGSQLHFFSPLADEVPESQADSIFLPGGYPELYAQQLANNQHFKTGMIEAARANKIIYGECGGFMVLGKSLEDRQGDIYPMLGLLPLHSSFKEPRLHLGYRQLHNISNFPLPKQARGHEFHYSRIIRQANAKSLFQICDAAGQDLGTCGLVCGRVAGSFIHLIDIL